MPKGCCWGYWIKVGITQHAAKYLDAHTDSETVGLNARIRGLERELVIQIINRFRLAKI